MLATISLIFPMLLALAASIDVVTLTIPNRISVALAGSFVLSAAAVGLDLHSAALHLLAGAAVLVAGFLLFWAGVLGGGDAKLLAGTALWVGAEQLAMLLLAVAITGGILAALLLIYRALPKPAGPRVATWLRRLYDPNSGMPYGVAICVGGLIVFPETIWFSALIL